MHKVKKVLIEFIAQFLAPCNVTTQLLSESKDRRLRLSERINLRMHLQFCRWCTDYGHQISFLEKALKQEAKTSDFSAISDRRLSEVARQRIKKSLSGNSDQ